MTEQDVEFRGGVFSRTLLLYGLYTLLSNAFFLIGYLRVCGHVWRRGLHCTTSASGSTISSAAPTWPLPTCWDGDLKTHTKRFRVSVLPGEAHP